ncbi:glycerate dehydrogenase [Ectothiorhodosinus mongolicus]|uniref:Glycerate dehydrogenase n=1 Tax=Ectothiorhodosinus mongolicus TaxID=233100 RepID=A0A1R3VMY5_9GAMM|nr:2-hydroxyacid dehydrogenase [Ectothiorhodosinus mongolicus]ULX56421.1 glycerate dehydrogenase [Ectothiorhodosinus mongolicus]SIT65950.1 glycerate dehydrogenase [Ectothiorhodosinus mongolicus]
MSQTSRQPGLSQGVILDLETLAPRDLDLSRLRACLPHWRDYEYTLPDQTAERMAGAEVVITNKVVVGAADMDAAPELELIVVSATGTNNVDLAAAAERGITVCNVRNYGTASVAQHVFALILALTTRLNEYQRDVQAGAWHASRQFCLLDHPIRELAGKSLGIVGHGTLGSATAALARAFGMRVLIAQRRGTTPQEGRTPFETVLSESDLLSLHCPLTPETQHLIDAQALRAMRSDALLINTARGAIVDNAALAEALRAGEIGGAGIDVLESEPPPEDHPLLQSDIPNLIVTPHIAWAAREARQRMVDLLADNITAFAAGHPINEVSA